MTWRVRRLHGWHAAAVLAIGLHVTAWTWASAAANPFAPLTDAQEYMRLGANLAAGRGFTQAVTPPYTPDLRRTPVYPGLLAALFTFTGPNASAAALMNVTLGLVTLLAVCWGVARRFGERAATITGLLLALDPLSLAYHTLVLTETTFALLLALAVAVLAASSGSWRRGALAGAILGVAALCRPIGLFLPIALAPIFLLGRRAGDGLARTAALCAMLAAYGVITGLWLVRNYAVFGAPVMTSLGGVNLYFHRAAYVEAERRGADVEQVRAEWERAFDAKAVGWSDREKLDWLESEGARIITNDLDGYLATYLRAIGRMLGPETHDTQLSWGLPGGSRAARAHVVVSWAHIGFAYVLALAGIVRARRAPDARRLAFVIVLTFGYFLLISGPEVYARFRMPLMPLVAALGGLAFMRPPAARPTFSRA